MKRISLLFWVAIVLTLGCHKKEAAPTTSVVPDQSPTPSESSTPVRAQSERSAASALPEKPLPPPPAYVATRAVNAVRETVVGEVDPFLTSQLRTFVNKNHRLPQSFSEFTRTSLDTVPNPPAGKRWAIDASSLEVKSIIAR